MDNFKTLVVSALRWAGYILLVVLLLAPLYSLLMPICSVNAFQLLYVLSFQVVNRTSQPLWITPVAAYNCGAFGILQQYMFGLPALAPLRVKDHLVRPGGRTWIHYNRKELATYHIVVRNDDAQYRQLLIDPLPSRDNYYGHRNTRFVQHVVEDWCALVPVADDVLTAARKRRFLGEWMLFLFGLAVLAVYLLAASMIR